MARITLLHTSDLHGYLTDKIATQIGELKKKYSPALLLDAGDAVSAGNIGVRISGEKGLRLISNAGYDALAVGNREFHPFKSWMKYKLHDAGFPILCANLGETCPDFVEPYHIFEVGGIRIAVFGLCVPMITGKMWARHISPFIFEDPIKTAENLISGIRNKADGVVALTHIGLTADKELSQQVKGIDLILGGHSHTPLTKPEGIEAPILHVAPHAKEIGCAILEKTDTGIQLASWTKIPLVNE